jgi:hypothetical protein
MFSEKIYEMFIPDPYFSPIPDPGYRGKKSTGSGSATQSRKITVLLKKIKNTHFTFFHKLPGRRPEHTFHREHFAGIQIHQSG